MFMMFTATCAKFNLLPAPLKRTINHGVIVGIILVAAFFTERQLTRGQDWGGDFAGYLSQAQSIVTGQMDDFVAANSQIISNSSAPLPGPIAYPWGFPLMLAPVVKWFGMNMLALKSVCFICFLLFLAMLGWGFARYHRGVWMYVLLSAFALNPDMTCFVNEIRSDIPFTLFSTLAVLFMGRTVVSRRVWLGPVWDGIVLGTLVAIAFFIRTNGVLILVTLGCVQGIDMLKWWLGRKNEARQADLQPVRVPSGLLAIQCIPYVVFVGLALGWRFYFPSGGAGHLETLKSISSQEVDKNMLYYFDLWADFFKGIDFSRILYGISIPFAVAGIAARLTQDRHIVIYIFLTLALYIVWPFRQGIRFLYPLIPFFVSFALTGLQQYCAGPAQRGLLFKRMVCILAILGLLYTMGDVTDEQGDKNLKAKREYRGSGPFSPRSQQMITFIKENTQPGDRIVFFKPRVMYWLTDRLSIRATSPAQLRCGDYLCTYSKGRSWAQMSREDIQSLLEHNRLKKVFANKEFTVYLVV